MSIQLYSIDDDEVISSKFLTGKSTYEFAVNQLYPLINKLDIQRKLQNSSFYKRLRDDLRNGCIIPPITLAFVEDKNQVPVNLKDAGTFVEKNIEKTFILDGIQRISAIYQAHTQPDLINKNLELQHPLFLNIIICKSMDNLLYRMITLNNGQKPMTANHQVEILLGNIYTFDDLNIIILSEKEKAGKRIEQSFNKADIIKSYLAFLSDSLAIDNRKIIEDKMDELIAMNILKSNITKNEIEFSMVIDLISKLSQSPKVKKWFDNTNNIIGFSVGIKKSFQALTDENLVAFENSIENFDEAFRGLKFSAIKLSRERRSLSKYFIENYSKLRNFDALEILDEFKEKELY